MEFISQKNNLIQFYPNHCTRKYQHFRRMKTVKKEEPFLISKQYSKVADYKEQPCPNLINCKIITCKYFHSQEEKRFNVTIAELNDLALSKEQSQSWVLEKGWLKVSQAISPLTSFSNQEALLLTHTVLKLRDKLNDQEEQVIGIDVNLISRRSVMDCEGVINMIKGMKSVENLFIKVSQITYFRNAQRKAMTFIINDDQIIELAIHEFNAKQPSTLKIVINKCSHLSFLEQLFQAIQEQQETLYRFEIELNDDLTTASIEIFKLIHKNFKALSNLRVFKLKIFSFQKKKKCFEINTEIVDSALQFVKQLEDKSIFYIQIFLNVCDLQVSKSISSLEIKSDPFLKKKRKAQKLLNQRLKQKQIHAYLIRKFQEDQMEKQQFSQVTFDFSSFYTLIHSKKYYKRINAKMKERKQEKLAKIYNRNIKNLLVEVWIIIEKIADSSLTKFTLKFFQFYFSYFCDDKKQMCLFRLQQGKALESHNKPIAQFDEFVGLGKLINKKLNLKYTYREYDGNIYHHQGQKLLCFNRYQYIRYFSFESGNGKFINDVVKDFSCISKVKCSRYDSYRLASLFLEKKKIFNAEITDLDFELKKCEELLQVRPYSISMDFQFLGTPLELNQLLNLFRKRMISIIKATRKIGKKNASFFLRQEQIYEIFELGQLGISNIDQIIGKWNNIKQLKKDIVPPQFNNNYGEVLNLCNGYEPILLNQTTWQSAIYEHSLTGQRIESKIS